MATVDQSTSVSTSSGVRVVVPTEKVPPLHNGDRLTRAEFERRYRAMPDVKKAELIEGIVYMPSPVRYTQHAKPHALLMGWLTYYFSKTPNLEIGDNGTSRLDEDNEPQPDAMLMLPKSAGGTSWIDKDSYVSGAPDLVCEIAASSASIDMNDKLNAYRRNGVREYLVVRTEDAVLDWFELVEGRYEPMAADADGLLKSKIFPGLWLDPKSLLAGDVPKIYAAVDAGTATEEHKAFAATLAQV